MRGLNTGSETIPKLRQTAYLGLTQPATTAAVSTAPAAPATQPVPAPAPTPAPAPVPAPPAAAAAPNVSAPPRATNSTVSFSPSPLTLPATGTATVNIVGNGNDFYAVDLTIAFEPGAFNVREVREGGFLSRDGQIVAFVQRMETENGMLRVSLERPPGSAPVGGTGNLVTLVLERARPGNSTLRITDFRIRDPQQNPSIGRATQVNVSAP